MTDTAFAKGKALAKSGRFHEALPLLKQAVGEDEASNPDAWLALAACHFRLDENDEFRAAIRKALEQDPDHAPSKRFLVQTTGSDLIPAADTGRPKIVMEEPVPPGRGSEGESRQREAARQGCFGLILMILSAVFSIRLLLAYFAV